MVRMAAVLGLLAGVIAPAHAQGPVLTRQDVEAWLDGYLGSALQRSEIAGAVVVVVKDGEVLFQKGYGLADVAARRPVDPAATLFRAASISKLFTATAVLQLVEQGKLGLDAEINRYLDFTLPPSFGQPVLLRNLLTHSAGFADVQKGSSPRDPKWLLPLGEYLRKHRPRRAFPRDDTPGYSNYGFALAAYIVQRVSGEPFEAYLEHHILQPLGMEHTTCRQPVPEPFLSGLSQVYRVAADPPRPVEITVWRGAGCIVTTAADMARFMIAHLHHGRFGDYQLLQSETARLMHARAFGPAPHINGMTLGFFQEDRNGRRIIGHDGDFGFHSDLHLFLDDDAGIFVSFNGDGVNTAVYAIREGLFEDFTDRYFPAPAPVDLPAVSGKEHARLAAGSYESSRRLTGPLGMFMLFNQVRVTDRGDGTIAIPTPPSGDVKVYREVRPWLWREAGGRGVIEMRVEQGRVKDYFDHPVGAFVRVPFWKSGRFNLPLLAGAGLTLLLTVLWWPIGALVRRYHGRRSPFPLDGREAGVYRLARLGACCSLLFLVGWAVVAMNLLSHFYLFNEGLDPWFRVLQALGTLGIAGTIPVLWSLRLTWAHRRWWASRVWSIALAVSSLAIVWFAVVFHLITIDLSY